MTFPLNPTIGSVAINMHQVFETLAFTVGYLYYLILRQKSGDFLNADVRLWILVGAAFGALFGSKLVGYLSVEPQIPMPLLRDIMFLKTQSIAGALLGGILGVETVKLILGIKAATGDLYTYPLILGIMIGRLGCFSQGVYDGTHGLESNLPWAMDMGDGIRRHPAQLYEIIFLGILWFGLRKVETKLQPGAKFKLFIVSYFTYRFLVEHIKPVYFYPIGLSAIQITCLLGIFYYWRLLAFPQKYLLKGN